MAGGEDFGAAAFGFVEAWRLVAGRLAAPWLWASHGCGGAAASAEAAATAAADNTALARPWRRRSARGMDGVGMRGVS